MTAPVLRETYFEEQRGLNAVMSKLTEMRFIWRATPNADIGIDGQIEAVGEDGMCEGHVLAAQVKSGKSYFEKQTDDAIFVDR